MGEMEKQRVHTPDIWCSDSGGLSPCCSQELQGIKDGVLQSVCECVCVRACVHAGGNDELAKVCATHLPHK